MIPPYHAFYLSILKVMADQRIYPNFELAQRVAAEMQLDQKECTETLSSGKAIYRDRINWACTYLKKAGLLESVKRGHLHITAEGLRVWESQPSVLDNAFLCRYPSFRAFFNHIPSTMQKPISSTVAVASENETPSDLLDKAVSELNRKLADDLMSEIMAKDSAFFETLVVRLLMKMGYGGSLADAGVTTQRSNDGGIDGIIREDKLGFDKIYIQAKRWDPESTVGRPEIHKFSGALQDKGASKGLFITTARFSDPAKESAEKQHIVLVDGDRLTRLMIEYNLGVSAVASYQIKSIDTDFFNEET